MHAHADKTKENKSQSVANGIAQKESSGDSTFVFRNNRPEAFAQRKLQEMVNNNSRLEQLKSSQESASHSQQVNQVTQMQALTDNSPKQQQSVWKYTEQTNSIIQRAKLNLRQDGTISGVSNFPNRPTSNIRGPQGQHLTAYVVFEDMIRSRVKDRTVQQAAAELINVLKEISMLPGMKVKSGEYLMPHIEGAVERLQSNDTDAKEVGEVIDVILSIRNKVPGTAERGTGGGHGEAQHSGMLETVETALRTDSWKDYWDQDVVSDQCRYSVWRLLDYDPPNPTDDNERNNIAIKIVTHFKSIISAYPLTDSWLNKRSDYFTTYMEAHRDDVGMPLAKVKPKELNAIFELVRSLL